MNKRQEPMIFNTNQDGFMKTAITTYKELEQKAKINNCFDVISEFEDYWNDEESFESNVKMMMNALCDGDYLSRQDWTEEEVNHAYEVLENVL